MADVLCFGNLQLDVLCRTVTALPAPSELRMIDDVSFALSGNGGTVAAALARLGVSVDLAGYSGADMIGREFRATLATLGVGADLLLPHPTAGTGTSIVAVAPDGERSILYVNGANVHVSLDAIADESLAGRKVVCVSSVFILPQFTGAAIGRLFARAHARGAATVLNIAWDGEGRGLPFLHPALAETDYFILSREEGRQLTGETHPDRILDRLAGLVRGAVVLTLGADGCLLRACADRDRSPSGSTEAHTYRIPAVPVEAIDTTGAGDAFVAGFVAGLVHGRDLVRCALLGCRVASFAVTGPGGYLRIPALAEVDRIDADTGQVMAETDARPATSTEEHLHAGS